VRRVLTAQPHIQVLPPKEFVRPQHDIDAAWHATRVQAPLQRLKSIDQWSSVLRLIRSMPQVKVASPAVTGAALGVRGGASRSLSLTAVDLALYQQIVNLQEKIVAEQARLESTELLMGMELASDLGLTIGDKLLLQSASGSSQYGVVAGILDLGNKGANQRNGFMALHSGQSLLGYPGGITGIDVTVHDVYAAELVAQRIQHLTGLQADSWIKTNAQFFSAISSQTMANTAIRFFVALSVAFGIASVLVVSVVQRSREIGILRAMGVSRGDIMGVFLLQGALMGLLGSGLGAGLAYGLLVLFSHIFKSPDGSALYVAQVEPLLVLAASALATAVGVLAALIPARRAARMDPVQAIRA